MTAPIVPKIAPVDIFIALDRPKVKRNDIVPLYAALLSDTDINWGAINRAIIDRWSKAGLTYIKERAWKSVTA